MTKPGMVHLRLYLLLHLGRALLHCPFAWHMDFTAPCRTYPVLQPKCTLSFKLNWVPWVIPKVGLPGWPHVMAGRVKEERQSRLLMYCTKLIRQILRLHPECRQWVMIQSLDPKASWRGYTKSIMQNIICNFFFFLLFLNNYHIFAKVMVQIRYETELNSVF